jgi:hypothetical protein
LVGREADKYRKIARIGFLSRSEKRTIATAAKSYYIAAIAVKSFLESRQFVAE